jgi:hypothetical protein
VKYSTIHRFSLARELGIRINLTGRPAILIGQFKHKISEMLYIDPEQICVNIVM